MKKLMVSLALLSMLPIPAGFSHCEIPCGIYDDAMRADMIEEHIATIEKSMATIRKLSNEEDRDYNQLVRWIGNKDKHAAAIQDIVTQYFMTQRIKPVDEDNPEEHKKYIRQLTLLHQMLVSAMKAKQTTDPVHVEKLRSLLARFRNAYFEPGQETHRH